MDIKGISGAVFKGVYDSFKGMLVIFYVDKEINERTRNRHSPSIRQKRPDTKEESPHRHKKHEESKVIHNVFQCCLLNGGVFLLSVLLFEYILLPSIGTLINMMFGSESFTTKVVWFWVEYFMLLIYRTAWLVPLLLLTKIINALWFQDIADSVYRYSRGRPSPFTSVSMLFADSVFSVVVQCLFLIQATATNFIPFYPVGYILYVIQMSLLYSLYSFEYKWFNMGWELHKRLSFIEENWPYFIGFGLPLTILTQLTESWIISGCIFSILFPFFIVSANEATPVMGVSDLNLQLFSLVVTGANCFFRKTIGKSKKTPSASSSHSQQPVKTYRR